MKTTNTVRGAAAAIMGAFFAANPWGGFGIDDLRAPELAAWLGLDELLTCRAVASLVKSGDLADRGTRGLARLGGGRWTA